MRRTVTLNVQYRMHPRLGEFVSDNFYKPYGEEFDSGLPIEDFQHSLQLCETDLTNKIAAWLDVPNTSGREVPASKSTKRPVEAKRVARCVHELLSKDRKLSVGVIAFYAAQRDQIMEELARDPLHIAEPDDEGGFRIREEWSRTTSGHERLRVGTVDAFQGKEFDVVLLSLTRSNTIKGQGLKALRSRYGFLLLENRLCVAMSRQKRMLVVVGDAEMARTAPENERALVALHNFLKLCGGEDGQFIRC